MNITRTYLNFWGRIASPTQRKLRTHAASVCTDVIVNLNDGNRQKEFHTFYSLSDYASAFAALRMMGVEVHVMTWLRPQAEWLFPMVDWLHELQGRCAPASILFDLEGPWVRGSSKAQRQDAADVIAEEFGCVRTGFTDVPMVGWGKVAPVAEVVDYWMPQVHTFGESKGPSAWYRKPGRLEKWTHKKWGARLSGGQELIPHLADYRVGRYRQTAAGLRKSIGTCFDLGYTSVAAWCPMKGPLNPDVWRDLKAQQGAA